MISGSWGNVVPFLRQRHGNRPWRHRGWHWHRVWLRLEWSGFGGTFVWGSIEVNEEFVDGFLVFDIKSSLDQSRRNDIIDIGNSLGNTYARKNSSNWAERIYPCRAKQSPCHAIQAPHGHPSRHPKAHQHDAVPSLHEELAYDRAGNGEPPTGDKVDLDRGIATRVVDVACSDLLDGHDGIESIGRGMAMGGDELGRRGW